MNGYAVHQALQVGLALSPLTSKRNYSSVGQAQSLIAIKYPGRDILKRAVRTVVAASVCLLLAACAGAPKLALKPEVKKSIRRVAVVEVAEPTSYYMNPGAAPGGAALYLFGALGGAILGGIEASRQESATAAFTSAVKPLEPKLNAIVLAKIEQGLAEKGYETVRVPAPPTTSNGEDYDLSKIEAAHDAVLVTRLSAGYAVNAGAVVPRVGLSVSLHPRQGGDKIFSDTYLYGTSKFGQMVWVESDPRYTIQSLEDVYKNTSVAVEGLRAGAGKVAERFVADL